MNNTDFFVQPLQTYHFLSVINSINVLSHIFYNNTLLTEENLFKPIPVVNSLCEYLHKHNNSENATIALGKKLLNNTDFYGSKENETIHFEYVDAMFNHIIATSVFAKFGNTFGYLSAVVNATNNLTLSFFKRKILKDLSKQTFLNQDYTISTLTPLSVERITEKLIFPLFPELKEGNDLRIIDANYIYAQAGLMFARSAQLNSRNASFEEYMTMSLSIKEGVLLGELNQTVLKIFQLPALLYFTHKNQRMLKNATFDSIINDPDFLNNAFNLLFSDLDIQQKQIANIQRKNPVNNFEKALFRYKNRTEYAEYILRRLCPVANDSEYQTEVTEYKFYYDDYNCKPDNNSLMPNINNLFSQQNEHIANLYSYVEKELVIEAFGTELIEFLQNPNVTVWPLQIYFKRRCGFRCQPFREKIRDDAIVFEIHNGTNKIIYALIHENNNITLHSAENDRALFMQKLGLHPNTRFIVPQNEKPLKSYYQSFDSFVTNLLEPWRKSFYNLLQNQGYDPTTGETVIGFLKHFIPFYNCYQTGKTENLMKTVCACIVDSLVLIPIFGQAANTGLKLVSAGIKPLLMNFQTGLKAFTIGQLVGISLRSGIRNIAAQAGKEISKQITKELFRDIGISILRTVDPGIELSYTLGKAGITSITKCFEIIGRKVSSLSKVLKSLNKVKQPVVSQVGSFKGHSVYVSSISGKDGYGIKHLNFEGRTVELRWIRGIDNEIPVVLVSDSNKRKRIYQEIDIETGELKATRWELNANNVLEVEVKPLAVRLKTIQVEGLSGKGRLNHPRIRMTNQLIEMRENVIREWSDRINEDVIKSTLQQYVLDNQNLRRVLFDYLALNGEMPYWIKDYKLTNVNEYQTLRYNSYVEDVLLTEEDAVNRVSVLYKKGYYLDVIEIDLISMFRYYSHNQLYSIVNFEDFCAIGNYLQNGHEKALLGSPEGLSIQNAFNKLATRLSDFPVYDVPRSFYKLVKSTVDIANLYKPGREVDFDFLTNLDYHFSQSIEGIEEMADNRNSLNILYELKLDNSYMVLDMEDLLPGIEASAILLPETKFVVEHSEYEILEGKSVYKVTMRNTLFSKSKWIARLNKNIDTINNGIQDYYTIINDFNVDLLN